MQRVFAWETRKRLRALGAYLPKEALADVASGAGRQ
jgi:hypothetical protein